MKTRNLGTALAGVGHVRNECETKPWNLEIGNMTGRADYLKHSGALESDPAPPSNDISELQENAAF